MPPEKCESAASYGNAFVVKAALTGNLLRVIGSSTPVKIPRPLFTVAIVAAAISSLALPRGVAGVVLNELNAGASERLLRWEANGVPRLGTGAKWYEAAYSDSLWQTAPGPFGFGTLTNPSVPIATGLEPKVRYLTPTVYYRKSFTVAPGDETRVDPLQLVIEYNDGFVAYLNGVEVARRNAGPVNKFIYHDQPAYNREVFSNTAPVPTTTLSETISLGAANTRLAAGTNILAIHHLNASVTDGTSYIKAGLQISGTPTVPLVSYNDPWRYFPGVVEPSGNVFDPSLLATGKQFVPWGTTVYDDSAWSTGTGPFGYGIGSPATNTQSIMQNIAASLYTRIVFNVSGAQANDPTPLKLIVGYEDGFVAYINGVEVARRNLGTPNTFTSFDAVADTSRSSIGQETIILDAANKLLVSGSNVLSIQAHNFTKIDADFHISGALQSNGGTTFVSSGGPWKYRAGSSEPITPNPDGEEEESTPEGPDSATDWVELYNDGATPIDLAGWRLTDNAANTVKWTFPSVVIPAGGYLVVICDGEDIKVPGANGFLHANFSLDTDGEYVGLYDGGGALVSQLSPGYPKQVPFQGFARDTDGIWKYTDLPTPGAANAGPYNLGVVAIPTVNNPGRFYTTSVSVTLSTTTPGATIRYTTDGSEPKETSTAVAGPLNLTTSTALRARAFLNGYLPSDTITHTYLINQSTARRSLAAVCLTGDSQQSFYRPFGVFAIQGGGYWSGGTAAPGSNFNGLWHYYTGNTASAATATGNPAYPVPSVPADPMAYHAPMQSGKPAERPVGVEILHANATPDLRTGAFLRCAGSPYSRPRYVLTNHNSANPNNGAWSSNSTQKPQLNLFFRDDLGQSPLQYPLVPGSVVSQYENIRLRAGKNDISNPFILDEFTRRLSLSMGQVAVRGDFVNVYVNSVFKGYFNICERPREPFFQQSRQTNAGFDVRNITVIADGDALAYNELMNFARTTSFTTYANYLSMQTRLDVVNLADYIILNVHAAMADWPGNNYVMDRERSVNGVFRFSVWDAEGGYGGFSRNPAYKSFNDIYTTNFSGETVPAKLLYSVLRNSAEFRLLCADRIQKHFFNNGTLVDSNLQAQWNALASQIQPILGEVNGGASVNATAFNRWISGQGTDTTRYTLDGGTTGNIVNCPNRRRALFTGYTDDTAGGQFIDGFFKSQLLWPNTIAPIFSQHGGNVVKGYSLSITNQNGATTTLYYTTNGVDPRTPGTGAPAGTPYSGPIIINQPTTVKARVRNNSNGEWSPLTEATFSTPGGFPVIISEVMYNPTPFNAVDGNEFEFVELHNTSNAPVSLFGLKLADAVEFTFPPGSSIAANGYGVVARNTAQFNARYPGVPVLGQYGPGSSLNNAGETISLLGLNDVVVFKVIYDDLAPWPVEADGAGNSLVPLNPQSFSTPLNASNGAEWRKSTNPGGSPGAIDPINIAPVYINELLSNPAAGQVDTVELYNPGPTVADIGDWWLSNSVTSPKKYRFPAGTTISAGGYLLVTEEQFNATPGQGNSFEFNKNGGEDVVLASGDASGNLTGFFDQYLGYSPTLRGVSLGTYTDSTSTVQFVQQSALTLGAVNSGPKVGPVVITEVMYNAPAGKVDFLELANISGEPVPLYDPATPANTWRVQGVEYTFPASIILQPRQILILTESTPATFRTAYGLGEEVLVFQYTGGVLVNNVGERVALQQPAEGQATPASVFVDVDFVNYKDTAPWPSTADGGGSSLERINWRAFGDDVANWRASAQFGSATALTPLPFDQWRNVYFTPAQIADSSYGGNDADPDKDGLSNFWEFAFGFDPLVKDAQTGYSVSLMNDGAAGPYLTIQYRRNLGATGLQFHMDTTGALGSWTLDGSVQVGTPVNNGDGTETIKRRDTQTTSEAAQRFMQFRINN